MATSPESTAGISVFLLTPSNLIREALKVILRDEFWVCGEASQIGEISDSYVSPNIIITEIERNDSDQRMKDIFTNFRGSNVVVFVSEQETDTIRACLALGASGVISKNMPLHSIGNALKLIASGEVIVPSSFIRNTCFGHHNGEDISKNNVLQSLSKREMEAISLLSKGKSNKEICLRLGVSEPTVKVVVSGIMRKSGLKNRTQLAVWAAKHLPAGLV